MSNYYQDLIVRISGLTSSESYVLYRLADRADKDGKRVYPGVALLSRETRLDERTVRYILHSLEDLGLIETVNARPGARRKEYVLTFENAIQNGVTRIQEKVRPQGKRVRVVEADVTSDMSQLPELPAPTRKRDTQPLVPPAPVVEEPQVVRYADYLHLPRVRSWYEAYELAAQSGNDTQADLCWNKMYEVIFRILDEEQVVPVEPQPTEQDKRLAVAPFGAR